MYPCDGCQQVAAHVAAASSLHSACRECGFLTLIDPRIRRLLRLPPLLPLSSSTTLSIQSSISLPLHKQHKNAAYSAAFKAYQLAEQSSRRQRAEEAKDGGESDTTDHALRLAQPTVSASSGKKRRKSSSVTSKPGEATLLRLREEVLAIGQLSFAQLLQPPSFQYGVQPLDSVPFTSHHLHSLHTTLQSLHSTPDALSSFHTAAVDFFAARASLVSSTERAQQGWSVLQRVRRTFAELRAEELRDNKSTAAPRQTSAHTDDEADEQREEQKADASTSARPNESTEAGTGATHSKAVQRGVMGIVENVNSCRLQRSSEQLLARAAPHLPLLSAINALLLPLYPELLQRTTDGGRRRAESVLGVVCTEREAEGAGGWEGEWADERVQLLLWCCWLLRCCYCGVSSVLQRAVYWAQRVEAPAQQAGESEAKANRESAVRSKPAASERAEGSAEMVQQASMLGDVEEKR